MAEREYTNIIEGAGINKQIIDLYKMICWKVTLTSDDVTRWHDQIFKSHAILKYKRDRIPENVCGI